MSDDAIPLEEARRRRRKSRTSRKATQPPEVPIGEAPEYSDEALARLFTYRHKDHWRFVSPFGRWLHFTGTHWEAENTLLATDLAREICREESMRAEGDRLPKVAAEVASRKTVAAVEGLARADREHAATAEQWDSNPWLLNTPAGTLDLRANQLLPHRPLDYLTKITAV
ncbi:MAG TPA: hypothetical protein VMA86_06095, partial [Acetobacteraceae bacterium]|nr:hypothetical protein [Acetobacteraceae bacterium]